MTSSRRVAIVTADDFGSSHAVNEAIVRAHEEGIVTGASLMVTGQACEEAIDQARAHPNLAVGLHLVVVCGRSVLSPSQIPHLVDSDGRFSSRPVWAGLAYRFSRTARRELRMEIEAQLRAFHETGLALSHVDGHLHMHLHPEVLGILLDLKEEFGIPAIRLPGEELGMTLALDRSRLVLKTAYFWIFRWLRAMSEGRLKSAGVAFSERVYGLLQSGRMTEEYLLKLIPQIRADRVEIYSHPTAETDERRSHSSRGASRSQLDALLSPRVRQALLASGFHLSTYREVAGGMGC